MNVPGSNVARHLRIAATERPDDPATKSPVAIHPTAEAKHETRTFRQLDQESDAAAAHLARAGLAAGDRVLLAVRPGHDLIVGKGLNCDIVSAGGTGSYQYSTEYPGITELQAGGGIFADPMYQKMCGVTGLNYALTVLATVVSRPTVPSRRAIPTARLLRTWPST